MLSRIAYLLCRIFFRRIIVSGSPYLGPGAIWCANHSSGIVDPAVMLGLVPVPLRPLSKHTLFEHPVMRPLLELVRAIPIFRMQDMKKDLLAEREALEKGIPLNEWRSNANSDAFKTVADALHQGDRVMLFPEGVSHDEPKMYKLKTGIARMALQAMAQSKDEKFMVVIQPVAIDYFEKDEFRSNVAFHFCEPVAVTSADLACDDVMLGIQESLNNGIAQFESWDEKRNWQFIFEVAYGRVAGSSREFCQFVSDFRMRFEPVSMATLQTFRRLLQAMRMTPTQLVTVEQRQLSKSFVWLVVRHFLFHFLIAGPVVILSGIFWAIPYRACAVLASLSTKERDVLATMKIAHGIWIFTLWLLLGGVVTFLTYTALFPKMPTLGIWIASLMTGPALLILDILCRERRDFFPGYWKLARLKLFHPRSWSEVMEEWKAATDKIVSVVHGRK